MKTLILNQDDIPDLDAVEMLADSLPRVMGGATITIKPKIVIETENIPAFFMLQDLLMGKVPQKALAAPATPTKAKTRNTKVERQGKRILSRYLVVAGPLKGQTLATQHLNKLLAKRDIAVPPGTVLSYPNKGNLVVIDNPNNEPYSLIPQKDAVLPAPARTSAELCSWEVILPGKKEPVECITLTERIQRLAQGLFETGTMLRHKGTPGLIPVTGEKGIPGQGLGMMIKGEPA